MQRVSVLIQKWQNLCQNETAWIDHQSHRPVCLHMQELVITTLFHRPKTTEGAFNLWRIQFLCALEKSFGNPTCCRCYLQLSSQSLLDSGPESRRSSWTSIGRAPSLHRKSQSGEMESLLSDTHSGCSSREQSLDQQEYLQVPVLHPPDCNGTTYHLPDSYYDDAPPTAHYHSDQEEEEIEEVIVWFFF